MRLLLIVFLSLSFGFLAHSQEISGFVETGDAGNTVPVEAANVQWAGTLSGTFTAADGGFSLPAPAVWPAQLIVSFVGFKTDTISLKSVPKRAIRVNLKPTIDLKAFEVVEREAATKMNTIDPIYVEEVGRKELQKAACCNLSESFETNASVDVLESDAVSGAKKIRMLGLDGVYTQILFENMPYIRGLASAYGLGYVPGTWPESIQITKGTGSVVNGYESITGQINLELIKPDEAERLYVNLYGNHRGRSEANVHAAHRFSDRWSTMVFAHASDVSVRNDNNHDGFLDMPLRRQYNVFNRWKYVGNRFMTQFGFRALAEDIQGGQTAFDYDKDFGKNEHYGVGVTARQAELWMKGGTVFPKFTATSLGLMASARIHSQDAFFGAKTYSGEQRSGYFNGIFQSIIGNTNHKYKVGTSLVFDDYRESFSDSAFTRTEIVPGVFGEYTLSTKKRFTAVLGMRADFHNLYGFQPGPRLHMKYSPRERSAIRLSIGRSFRVANAFVEQSSVFASSRKVIVEETFKAEEAWSGGASIVHNFKVGDIEVVGSADFFHTLFENQVVVDLERPNEVRFYNLDGSSYSNSFQVGFDLEPIERLTVRTAYKWQDVRVTYRSTLKSKPMVPAHRGLLNVGYTTKFDKWMFDATGQLVGTSRIPQLSAGIDQRVRTERSDAYFVLNSQITRGFKRWKLYVGVENATGYRQPQPIISADNPFGSTFDASMVWGPVNGRIIYAGMRWSIK